MADEAGEDRKSKAADLVLIHDPQERARREVKNGLKQFDEVLATIEHYRDTKRPFKLRLSMILGLQRTALAGISTFAGLTRPAEVAIVHKQGRRSVLAQALGRDFKGKISPVLYIAGIALAFAAP